MDNKLHDKIMKTIHKQIGYRPGDVYHETYMMQKEAFHKLFGSMRYHTCDPYPPECSKRMWSIHSSEFNCPIFGDTPEEEEAYLKMLALKSVAIPMDDRTHQAILRWIKNDKGNEEEEHEEKQENIQSKKG